MGGEWTEATVGDAFDLINGYAFKSADFIGQGVPVIKIKNVKAGEFSEHDFSYVSEDFLKNRGNKLACFGDLLISMSGNRHDGSPETWVGKVAQFRKTNNYFINQRVGALRVKKGVQMDSRFASYLLSSMPYQELFIAIATSSGGQANLSPAQILGAPMRYPAIPEQRAIAHILGTLDDKIELNRRRNQTLEAMARALFKDWFIDFGPMRRNAAKAQNQPSPGLRPPSPSGRGFENTAHEPLPSPPGRGAGGEGVIEGQTFDHLFPDRLDDEGKPEGWRFTTLANFASLNPESWTKKNAPHEIRYVDLSNTKQGTIEGAVRMPWSEAPSRAQRILRIGDTIVGTVRPGNESFALISDEGMTGSTGFAVLRPQEKYFRDFVFLAATSSENIERLSHLADGAAYPAVRPNVVLASPVTVPSGEVVSDVLRGFANAVSGLVDAIEHNKRESRILAQLRDTLLPKLISGELRIADAEQLLEKRT